MDIQTRLVHAGEERIKGAVVTPIFQSSTFVSQDEQDYDAIRYLRLNNTPNHRALHAKLAAVCGGEDALVAGSGMAAITTALITVLNSGDHLLIQDCLYG
ncbi:MAG: PLP-dependent transferase, partial [Candidatus Latescibacteria bacterium]|nr:PLP-dependent transferase [Candidatus Latescibacterota bacterium]